MRPDSSSFALAVAGVLFLFYVLVKLRYSLLPASAGSREAKLRIQSAKARARDRAATPAAKAEAWRDAAQAALEGLGRPNLAASYARRAERADPSDEEAVQVLSVSLHQAGRLRALERLLWRRLAKEDVGQPAYARAYNELIALYEGAMKRPERAIVLRRMRVGLTSIPPSD